MKNKNSLRLAVTAALVSGFFSSQVSAAGFALIENSASGMGNAFAGGSAIADDASTVWFNPAGMTRLKGSQIIIAGHFINPSSDFKNDGSNLGPNAGGAPLTGDDDDGGDPAFVPNFYYVTDLGGDTWFGVGVSVPFGLATEYDDEWIGRYHATKSEVHTININPSFGFKYNDKLSLGMGISVQYIEAKLENRIDSALTCAGFQQATGANPNDCLSPLLGSGGTGTLIPGTEAQDSSQAMEGDDWNIGWNIGMLYNIDDSSRIGIAYRSSVESNLEGDVDFEVNSELQSIISASAVNPAFLSDSDIDAGIELPAQMSLSYVRDINPKLTLMADLTWTDWSNFDELVIKFDNLGQPTSVQPENWEDSYRYAIGANYLVNDKVKLRFGVALDETPIPNAEDRTARIPGEERTWLSVGLGYTIDTETSIDIGFTHIMVDDPEINNTIPGSEQQLIGEYEADVNIFSVQGNFNF